MPGPTIWRSACNTWPTSRPEARIFSISFCDFPMIIGAQTSVGVHDPFKVGIDLFRRSRSTNSMQTSGALIIIEQGCSLPIISFQSHSDSFRRVIGAMIQLRFGVMVALAVYFRRPKIDIVNLFTNWTDTTPRHPLFQKLQRNVQKNRFQLSILPCGQLLEHFGLGRRPRKPVEYVPITISVFRCSTFDDSNYQFIGNQPS